MRRIVWDENKDAINRKKHRVSFPEASEVFFDPLMVTKADHRHAADEMRFFSLGETRAKRLLAVAHTEEDEFIRIITARDATATERRGYEEGE
jgi:uncharacterized DUF497 family protein